MTQNSWNTTFTLGEGNSRLSYERPSPEQKRDRYLRLAERASKRSMAAGPPLQQAYDQLALAYQVMAGSAFSLEAYRQAKLGSQLRVYARTRDRLDAIAGYCCCDECLTLLVGVPRSSIIIATRRLGTELGYAKYVGPCALCDEHRPVTQAAANAPETPLNVTPRAED